MTREQMVALLILDGWFPIGNCKLRGRVGLQRLVRYDKTFEEHEYHIVCRHRKTKLNRGELEFYEAYYEGIVTSSDTPWAYLGDQDVVDFYKYIMENGL